MVLSISGIVLTLVITAVMLHTRYLRLGGALVAACLGYFLATSGAAPAINGFFTSLAKALAALGHSLG